MMLRLSAILLTALLAACSGGNGGSASVAAGSTSVTVSLGSGTAGGAITNVVPANVRSISVTALYGGTVIAGPVIANAPNFAVTIVVPNGNGIVIRASAFDAVNAGGAKIYEGNSAPVDLTGLPVTVPVILSMWITISPANSQVLPLGIVPLTATVAGVAPSSASRLLWDGGIGTVFPIDAYGGLVEWTAPAGAGTYTVSARVDPAANPDQSPNIVGQATVTVLPETDTDGDGLSDRVEIQVTLTDPNKPDTDGDGFTDGLEYFNGSDPTLLNGALITPLSGLALQTVIRQAAGDHFGTSFTSYTAAGGIYTTVGMPGIDDPLLLTPDVGGFQEFLFPAAGGPVSLGRSVVGQTANGLLGSNLASDGASMILVQEPGSNSVLNYDPYILPPIPTYTGQSGQFGNAMVFFFNGGAAPIPLIADPLSRTIDYIDPYGQLINLMTGATAGFASSLVSANFVGTRTFPADNLVVGSPDASSAAGIVEIYDNSAFPPPQPPQVTLSGMNAGDRFGAALATGDLNGDTYGDLVVGAPGADQVYVYYGPLPFTAPSAVIAGQAGSQFGSSLAVGDINADSYADIVVGAPLADVTGGYVDAGIIHVFSGNGLKEFKRFNGYLPGQDFASVIYVSNVNGDVYGDILVGEPLNDVYATDAGAAYFFPGP